MMITKTTMMIIMMMILMMMMMIMMMMMMMMMVMMVMTTTTMMMMMMMMMIMMMIMILTILFSKPLCFRHCTECKEPKPVTNTQIVYVKPVRECTATLLCSSTCTSGYQLGTTDHTGCRSCTCPSKHQVSTSRYMFDKLKYLVYVAVLNT